MIDLFTLGPLELRDGSDRTIQSVLRRPKRVALLAYLAASRPPGPVRRDSLVGVFWPESRDRRARHALNQSLYVLRRALGEDVLVSAGDDGVTLNRERIRCDVWAFREALEARRREDALGLYRGPLLEGFHLSAAGFERWLAGERRQLEQRARQAGLELSREREARGDREGALRWARRVSALVPYDETVHRRLVTLLADSGNRAGAIREHEAFVERLRGDLDLSPSEESADLAEEIRDRKVSHGEASKTRGPGGGEKTAASDEPDLPGGDGPAGDGAASSPSAGSGTDSGVPRPKSDPPWIRRRTWAVALALLVLGVLAVGAGGLLGPGGISREPGEATRRAGNRAPSPHRIAVLPFRVQGDEELAYLREGMVELLSAELDGAGRMRTVAPRALLDFVGRRAEAGEDQESSGRTVARSLAERFGAGRLVRGSVVEAGGRAVVYADLYDDRARRIAAASAGPGEEEEIFRLVDQLARRLIGQEYAERGRERASLAAKTTESLAALKAYLAGVRAFREARYDEAVDHLERAVAVDSAFALAWYRLAVASDWTVEPGRSPEAARRALRYSDRLPARERRLLEAWRAYTAGENAEAERLYRNILESYPDDVEARYQLGEVLFHFGWKELHPTREVRRAFERVLELDENHEGALLHLARLAAAAGHREEVAELADRYLEAQPAGREAVEMRVLRAIAGGDPEARARSLAAMRRLDPSVPFAALWTVAYARDPSAVADLGRLLAEPDRPAGPRAAGHLYLGIVEFARGRWRAAKRELARAAPLAPPWSVRWARELEALFATAPFLALPERALMEIRASLERESGRDRRGANSPAPPFLRTHEGIHADLATYLSGLLAARLGEVEAARARAEDLLDDPSPPVVRELARGLRASVLRVSSNGDAALEELERLREPPRYEQGLGSPFYQLSRERYLRALLLEKSGRTEDALRLYSSFPRSVHDLAYVAPSHLRTAGIHDRLGRADRALEHYRRALELWGDVDPELQPLVDRARRRVAALSGPASR